jgi:hypothetical protein
MKVMPNASAAAAQAAAPASFVKSVAIANALASHTRPVSRQETNNTKNAVAP